MNKVAIVYWSGTGNTETMANAIHAGVLEGGGEAVLLTSAQFDARQMEDFSVIAFGCPAMGAEVLEESEFEPMFEGLEGTLGGKKLVLFGSYGWGDGQWMRDWCSRCQNAGANLYDEEGLICNEAPDQDGEQTCRELGAKLAAW